MTLSQFVRGRAGDSSCPAFLYLTSILAGSNRKYVGADAFRFSLSGDRAGGSQEVPSGGLDTGAGAGVSGVCGAGAASISPFAAGTGER